MNLVNSSWLPARRADGTRATIRPAEITADLAANPIVALEWPRADFRLAALEFLIGLLATACPPADEKSWSEGWENPPPPEHLSEFFALPAHAFELDGAGPRFMQDLEDLHGEPDIPETLLIEAPGEATRRKNTALLVKSGRVHRLSRAAAAMALYTLQSYAPAGGRGNLTSLRGGGPLTTLALPGGDRPTLWQILWANVPAGELPRPAELPRVFPWLAPTRTAGPFPATTPADAHPLQAFWGMPRRIRLDFAENPSSLPCDLTGETDSVLVTGWRQRPNGVKYMSWDHPLSPYYRDTKNNVWLPVHPQPDGVGYRHWVALAFHATDERRPARCIDEWRRRSLDVPRSVRDETRLLAAGYDMDNMKARGFVESEMPLPGGDPARTEALARLARGLVEAASEAAAALRRAVRDARYGEKTAFDSAPLAILSQSFWSATQDRFFDALAAMADVDGETALAAAAPRWRELLRATTLRLFDESAPLDPSAASFDPRKIVTARRNLFGTFEGRGIFGTRLFTALLLPLPETRPKPPPRHPKEAA